MRFKQRVYGGSTVVLDIAISFDVVLHVLCFLREQLVEAQVPVREVVLRSEVWFVLKLLLPFAVDQRFEALAVVQCSTE